MQKCSPQSPTQWIMVNRFLIPPCFYSTTKGHPSFPEKRDGVPLPCLWQWHNAVSNNTMSSHTPSCWCGPQSGHHCSYYRFWISSLQQCHTHKKYKIISYWVNSLPTTFKEWFLSGFPVHLFKEPFCWKQDCCVSNSLCVYSLCNPLIPLMREFVFLILKK